MKILVTGATGLIGRVLCQKLASEGQRIVVLTRRPEIVNVMAGSVSFQWEPEKGPPPINAWDGVEAIIHLAGESVAGGRWTEEKKRRIRNSRVAGTQNLINGIKGLSKPPRVLISTSGVNFYGSRGDEILTEESIRGHDFLSDVCRDWEFEADRARELGLRVTKVRIGAVLSLAGGALEKMLSPFKLGLGGRLGSGKQWFPWIHIDDIVGILRHVLVTQAINGPINAVAPGIVNNEEFTKELAAALHRPVFFPVPEFALRILVGEMSDVILASLRVVPKVAQETEYTFHFPQLRQALEDLLGQKREIK